MSAPPLLMKTAVLLSLCAPLLASPLTFDNLPLGKLDEPLLLRTYVPDLDIDPAVFSQHGLGKKTAKYNVGKGRDSAGEDHPVKGVPAAIAANFGPALSYVFDTTECRLLYAWQGGFLDMTPYWGDQDKGNRRSFDYLPRLSGTLFHKTQGPHPLLINGKSLSDLGPRVFTGYKLENKIPTFRFSVGDQAFTLRITPSKMPLSLDAIITGPANSTLGYRGIDATGQGELAFTLTGSELEKYQGLPRNNHLTKATVAAGEDLFATYGCLACHSLDGSVGHGPSLAGVAGHQVKIEGPANPVLADTAYLIESIKAPNAKIVAGYSPNYMPPFQLPEIEYQALVLYIQSLAEPE